MRYRLLALCIILAGCASVPKYIDHPADARDKANQAPGRVIGREVGREIEFHNELTVPNVLVQKATTNPVELTVRQVASQEGCDQDFLVQVAKKESNLKVSASNKRSSSKGLFQFVNSTWNHFVKKDERVKHNGRADATQSTIAACHYMKSIRKSLKAGLGRKATNQEVYMGFFMGPGTALNLLRASESAPIEKVMSHQALRANPGLKGLTVGQAKKRISRGIE